MGTPLPPYGRLRTFPRKWLTTVAGARIFDLLHRVRFPPAPNQRHTIMPLNCDHLSKLNTHEQGSKGKGRSVTSPTRLAGWATPEKQWALNSFWPSRSRSQLNPLMRLNLFRLSALASRPTFGPPSSQGSRGSRGGRCHTGPVGGLHPRQRPSLREVALLRLTQCFELGAAAGSDSLLTDSPSWVKSNRPRCSRRAGRPIPAEH